MFKESNLVESQSHTISSEVYARLPAFNSKYLIASFPVNLYNGFCDLSLPNLLDNYFVDWEYMTKKGSSIT